MGCGCGGGSQARREPMTPAEQRRADIEESRLSSGAAPGYSEGEHAPGYTPPDPAAENQ